MQNTAFHSFPAQQHLRFYSPPELKLSLTSSAISCPMCLSWFTFVSSVWEPSKADGLPTAFLCITRITLCSQPCTIILSILIPYVILTIKDVSHKLHSRKNVCPICCKKNKEISWVLTGLKSSDESSTAHFLFDLSSVLMPSALDFVPTNLWGSAIWLQKKVTFSGRRWLWLSE